MIKSTTWTASLLTVLLISVNAWAQIGSPPESVAANGPAVTISVRNINEKRNLLPKTTIGFNHGASARLAVAVY